MLRIEEANKLELALSIKALVARALADELIEGGDVRYGPEPTSRESAIWSLSGGKQT